MIAVPRSRQRRPTSKPLAASRPSRAPASKTPESVMARNWHRLTRRLLFVLFLVSLLIGLGIWWQARERLKPAQSEPDDRIITLNLNEKGEVRLPSLDTVGGDSSLTNPAQITVYMRRQYK